MAGCDLEQRPKLRKSSPDQNFDSSISSLDWKGKKSEPGSIPPKTQTVILLLSKIMTALFLITFLAFRCMLLNELSE